MEWLDSHRLNSHHIGETRPQADPVPPTASQKQYKVEQRHQLAEEESHAEEPTGKSTGGFAKYILVRIDGPRGKGSTCRESSFDLWWDWFINRLWPNRVRTHTDVQAIGVLEEQLEAATDHTVKCDTYSREIVINFQIFAKFEGFEVDKCYKSSSGPSRCRWNILTQAHYQVNEYWQYEIPKSSVAFIW